MLWKIRAELDPILSSHALQFLHGAIHADSPSPYLFDKCGNSTRHWRPDKQYAFFMMTYFQHVSNNARNRPAPRAIIGINSSIMAKSGIRPVCMQQIVDHCHKFFTEHGVFCLDFSFNTEQAQYSVNLCAGLMFAAVGNLSLGNEITCQCGQNAGADP